MLVHLNGQLVPHERAAVSVFDRGFIFGDALYEGLRAITDPRTGRTRVIGMDHHIDRLASGLREAKIGWDAGLLQPLTHELLSANGLADAFVYWQITRGTPDLSRGPSRGRVPGRLAPTVFGYCAPLPAVDFRNPTPALKHASVQPDMRWLRGSMKSTSLLGNVLAAMDAAEADAEEAILYRRAGAPGGEGSSVVTEGTYTNVVIAKAGGGGGGGELLTPALDSAPLLAGVTRRLLVDHEPSLREGRVTLDDLRIAREVILIGTTTMVTAVTHLDGAVVGDGTAGPEARRLMGRLCGLVESGQDERPPAH